MPARTFSFATGHPAFAGHFPSSPVVPGALLLDEVVAAIAPGQKLTVRRAKFLRPVRPDETVTLSWEPAAGGSAFECRLDGDALVMTGTLAPEPGA